jgi:predicted DNA repair protein MutK
MAGSSLLALLDDIATVLDDVSAMTKIAAKKTAGVLGDDLALNAQQVQGVVADRELPVVWAVAKGSLVNKAILVPAALALSALWHQAVTPLLMLGGAYLCFEGFEKIAHKLLHPQPPEPDPAVVVEPVAIDLVALEKQKVKGAVRTDFILSAEIVAITLGVVADEPFGRQVAVLSGIAVAMTVGVYGLVAAIVKLDDLGLYLAMRGSKAQRAFGRGIVRAAPMLMKFLSVAGTIAMFLVGGGILTHGIGPLHHAIEGLSAGAGEFAGLVAAVLDGMTGVVAGALLVGLVVAGSRVKGLVRAG